MTSCSFDYLVYQAFVANVDFPRIQNSFLAIYPAQITI